MPLLDDVRPMQVYEHRGKLYSVISVCQEPTATIRNLSDDTDEIGGAIRALIFRDCVFVPPTEVARRRFELEQEGEPIGKIIGFIVCEETGQLRLRVKPSHPPAACQWMGERLRGERVGFFAAGMERWHEVYLVQSVSGKEDDTSLVDVILMEPADPDVAYKTLKPRAMFIDREHSADLVAVRQDRLSR
jgi:hypothetical protein